MGFVRQTQRRAIEQLRPHADNLPHWPALVGERFFLTDGRQLYYWGTSEGYGTCSDIHGMNVVVLADEGPGITINKNEAEKMASASYAVLLESALEVENHYEQTVWLLEYIGTADGDMHLNLTEYFAVYIPVL